MGWRLSGVVDWRFPQRVNDGGCGLLWIDRHSVFRPQWLALE